MVGARHHEVTNESNVNKDTQAKTRNLQRKWRNKRGAPRGWGPGSYEKELGSSSQERGVSSCIHAAICVLVEDGQP